MDKTTKNLGSTTPKSNQSQKEKEYHLTVPLSELNLKRFIGTTRFKRLKY